MCIPTNEAEFKKLLQNSSLDFLDNMQHMIKAEISSRQPTPTSLIKYIPDFYSEELLMDTVWAECEHLIPDQSKRKVSTQWLCPTLEPYVYADADPIHTAKDIKDFAGITKLLSFVNASDLVDGPLDSCLILKYPSSKAALSLHADNEPQIDQSKSICPFTLGCSRKLEFFSTLKRSKKVLEVDMDNGSLVIMRPGTQQILKHCVRADTSNKDTSSVRYCLSFRALAKKHELHTDDSPSPCNAPILAGSQSDLLDQQNTKEAPKRIICLVDGDSYAARLDAQKLGKDKCEVINIAKGGSRISDVQGQLQNFFNDYGSEVSVKKLIISVGTNDIRNCKQGVDHLKGPLRKLCDVINDLSPITKVFFQSLIPLPLNHHNDNITIDNVNNMNINIFNCCRFRKYYYINVMKSFLEPPMYGRPRLRNIYLFTPGDIHPNRRGMGILAKSYIFAIHSLYFDPLIFQ